MVALLHGLIGAGRAARRGGAGEAGWSWEVLLGLVCGFIACGTARGETGMSSPALPHGEVYQRASAEFKEAVLFKPVEPRSNNLAFVLAPWILQEVGGEDAGAWSVKRQSAGRDVLATSSDAASSTLSLRDHFGALGWSNGVPIIDLSRPTVYVLTDTVPMRGKVMVRFTYVWCYSGAALPAQGIRLTLNAAGQPVIWETLEDDSGAEVIFVSRSLETAALKEFGKPLAGRRYAVERSPEEAPNVVVARAIDDGPAAMGPMVYLSAGSRSVSTVICRCMAAQAKRLVQTRSYELAPIEAQALNSVRTRARGRTAFGSDDPQSGNCVEKCLRLPERF